MASPLDVAELAELAALIDKLAAVGINMTEPGVTPPSAAETDPGSDSTAGSPIGSGPLAGMTVVVTGAMTGDLERLTRNEFLVQSSGSKKTSLVVAGEGASSRRAKADQLGIRRRHLGRVRRPCCRPPRLSRTKTLRRVPAVVRRRSQ
ncbi:hypothetical protein [Streptomyces puniciscabiei]|uniref:hypothetical protein n=1 Tax=Streptomyces puniciscabiei TaxID=164348 RepID=UPI0006EBC675|nr:hypothetical protein [Streptomyces puniciscabiei]